MSDYSEFCEIPVKPCFQLITRSFFLTYSNLVEFDQKRALDIFYPFLLAYAVERDPSNLNYILVCAEKHQNGVTHVHALLVFKKERMMTVNNLLTYEGHRPQLLKTRCLSASVNYLKKDSIFNEMPKFEDTGLTDKTFKTRNRSKRLPENFDDIPLDIQQNRKANFEFMMANPFMKLMEGGAIPFNNICVFKKNIEYAKQQKALEDQPYERPLKCFWIFGPTAIGKSHFVRNNCGNSLYIKDAKNKWWDGYDGEKTVLIEEGQDFHSDQYLKIWSDKYTFRGEFKGGSKPIYEYNKMYITSNYLPHKAFKLDNTAIQKESLQALMRRFRFATIFNGNDQLSAYNPLDEHTYPKIVVRSIEELHQQRDILNADKKLAWLQLIPEIPQQTGEFLII